MKKDFFAAEILLNGTGISILDAARLIKNIMDMMPNSMCNITAIQYCRRVIECGQMHYRSIESEMSVKEGFKLYLETKRDLRHASFCDIKYVGSRILRKCPEFANRNFSEISLADCEKCLSSTFATESKFNQKEQCYTESSRQCGTVRKLSKSSIFCEVNASQFNKGRTIMHGLFEFAVRCQWCERNPVKLVKKKKVIEAEIKPLSLVQSKKILNTATASQYKSCAAAIGVMLWAGLRPTEVRRLKWQDIDLSEGIITVRSQCSKTGGIRQVEICPALNYWLAKYKECESTYLCPSDWLVRWRKIRNESGFKNSWIPDILRHTYASFYAKCYRDLPRLQLNMGHRDLTLLRSRYVNMSDITKSDAKIYFSNIVFN